MWRQFEIFEPSFLFCLDEQLEDEDVVGSSDHFFERKVDQRSKKQEAIRHRFPFWSLKKYQFSYSK
jgi:hypothetical protein